MKAEIRMICPQVKKQQKLPASHQKLQAEGAGGGAGRESMEQFLSKSSKETNLADTLSSDF